MLQQRKGLPISPFQSEQNWKMQSNCWILPQTLSLGWDNAQWCVWTRFRPVFKFGKLLTKISLLCVVRFMILANSIFQNQWATHLFIQRIPNSKFFNQSEQVLLVLRITKSSKRQGSFGLVKKTAKIWNLWNYVVSSTIFT